MKTEETPKTKPTKRATAAATPAAATTTPPSSPRRSIGLWTRISVRLSQTEKLLLTKYLSVLLLSGLPIDEAIDILLQQAKGPLKQILQTLHDAVRSGNTLTSGLQQYPHVFSNVFTSLVEAGESSGMLQKNLEHLALQMQKEHELRKKITGALMYPSIVMMSALVISVGIVVFVLPNITSLFASLNVPLPWTTRVLLWVAKLFSEHGFLLAVGAAASVVALMIIRSIRAFHPVTHWILLHVPVIGSIVRNTNLARITRLLGTLLQSGMPISTALTVTISIIKNVRYRKLFSNLLVMLSQGRTIAHGLANADYLVPPIALRLIRVGEETGTLGDMLIYLSNFYEQEVDDATKNATTLLEPLMIIFIGLMVGVLAFSIISPIYSVVGSI